MRGVPFKTRFLIFYLDEEKEIQVFRPDENIQDTNALKYMLALFRQEFPKCADFWYDDCKSFKPRVKPDGTISL